MPKKSKEIWKVYKNVFDNFTIKNLFKLITQGLFEGLASPIKIGKEANIFSAKRKDGSLVIVKIYRLHSCNFNKMYNYIRLDPRFQNLKKKRREVIFAWVQREYRNLIKARAGGVRVPTPYSCVYNVIVMEYIGDDAPALQLKDHPPKDKKLFFRLVLKNIKKLYDAGLVHGDLSEFNILNYKETPIFIDFSQSTTTESQNSKELLERDVHNVCRYFRKIGLKVDEAVVLKNCKMR
ncbi:MAG: serine protein kinase RIO [Candidatus Woesearchaeota archaeon]